MKIELLNILSCPICKNNISLELSNPKYDDKEIRDADLKCLSCGSQHSIERGVVKLLGKPPEHVHKEADGLARFAEVMRADGWGKEKILSLPYGQQDGYWYVQAISMQQLLATVNFKAGESILDIGSNTCWATNMLARQGLNAIALDIALIELQGLHTADLFFDDPRGSYFERVLGSMFDMPFKSGTLDYVFACEVLHHSSPHELPVTLAESFRVLKPGGKLLVINEPLKWPSNLKKDHGKEVASFEGNENVYFVHSYWLAAKRAGFRIKFVEPAYHSLFQGAELPNKNLERLRRLLPTRPWLRKITTLWLLLFGGGPVAMNMVCTKPA